MKHLPKYIGKNVSDLKLQKKYGIDIVGIINKDGAYIIKPSGNIILSKEDKIITMGETDNFNLFKKELSV